MTMIFQFFVFTCACALVAAADVPADGSIPNYLKFIKGAIQILQENVLSMDGNVPALNDARRHYAAIVRVVSTEAVVGCNLGHDYYRDYQQNINASLTYANANPQEVIQITQKVVNDVLEAISKHEWEIVTAAGVVAIQLIQDDKAYFAQSSQNLSSHNFVITGAEKLRNIVLALSNLYKLLYGPECDLSTPLLKTSI